MQRWLHERDFPENALDFCPRTGGEGAEFRRTTVRADIVIVKRTGLCFLEGRGAAVVAN